MNVDRFAQQVEGAHLRLVKLYQDATEAQLLQNNLSKASFEASSLLPNAFKELGIASEELQVAVEELRQKNKELTAARAAVEAEQQRYRNLFEFVPDGYLVTDTVGIIREANRVAAASLNVSQQLLVGKSVITFVPQAERQSFRSELNWLHQQANHFTGASTEEALILRRRHEWEIRLQPRHGKPLNVAVAVTAIREPNSKPPVTLRWLLHDITHYKQVEAVLEKGDDLSHDFPVHDYSKKESIPLNSQVIWQVSQGLVKLSTFCDTGEEVLLGLAGPLMLFGPSLTSLQTFQAIALSEVQLVCLPLDKIAASPYLAQALLPQTNQRLQHTEVLLAISGERRVSDRLHRLLRLLKQEIGQPVAQGTRLSIRLTHDDLASACCTTRVTITRLFSKLQQQGKLTLCPKHHIILRQGF
jgi:PAS domain S-box-containing protein